MKTVAELIARIDGLLPKWRTWFPNEESAVDIPRRDLLVIVDDARDAARLRERVTELEKMLGEWLKEPRACIAVAKDCTNEDGCGCLYCRTDNLIRTG